MEPVIVRFSMTADDYATIARTLQRRGIVIASALLISVFVPMSALIILYMKDNERTGPLERLIPYALIVLIVAFALIGLSLLVLVYYRRFSIRNIKKNQELMGETIMEFGEERIKISSPGTRSNVDWGHFGETLVYPDFYVVGLSSYPGEGYIIPKRAFDTSKQEQAFRALLTRKVKITDKPT
jgi:hypothetical protein